MRSRGPATDVHRQLPPGELIADRYVAEEPLGAGGMGQVEKVFDRRAGRHVALKLLGAASERRERGGDLEVMFEREYQTLAELAHPRIIEVFDYGICEHGRYYTMELLSGVELLDALPLEWSKVCSILRDVASALALLHSRRLLHRDITARNVHVQPDGRAKLIDFGTLTAIGPAAGLVGTAPHVAPEAFHGQPLDPRTDLFGLGALAYVALTGRHAYPAHTLSQLQDVWRSPAPEPSRLVPGIPAELDGLVLSLLALDRQARPGSAAEVMEHLTAIARLEPHEAPGVAAAYVASPALVGRESQLLRFRQSLLRTVRGRGSSTLVAGPPGVGRSRLLSAYRMEARMLNMPVVHAQCTATSPFATVRKLIEALLEGRPELIHHPHLRPSGILAGLAEDTLPSPENTAGEQVETVSEALLELVLEVAARAGALISIDDLHSCDHESGVAILRLAQASQQCTRFVASVDSHRADGTIVEVLSQHVAREELQPLDAEQTRLLLSSVFGEVPGLAEAADWAFAVSAGSPGIIMQLAQHLVDRGMASYESGGWSLPRDFARLQLPRSVEEAWSVRVGTLSEQGQTLATALALCLENHPLPEHQHGRLWLTEHRNGEAETAERLAAHRVFTELMSRDILRRDADAVRFVHRQLRESLVERSSPARRAQLHRRLAEAFRETEGTHPLVVAHHLYEAGDEAGCLELALVFLETSGDSRDDRNREFALEAQCLERALRTARATGRPRSVTTPMLVNLMGLAHRHDRSLARYFDDAVEQASHDIGMHRRGEVLADLGRDAEPAAVISECMARQRAAREAEPPERRGQTPEQAADALARSAHRMAAVCLETLDAGAVTHLPALVEPLAALSVALEGTLELTYVIRNHILGLRHEHRRIEFVRRWREPVAGLNEGARVGTVRICSAYDGWFRAELGASDAMRYADELLEQPAYETLGWDVQYGAHLYQGDVEAAHKARERRNVTLAQRRGSLRGHCAASVYHEVRAHSLSGDLMGLKRGLGAVEQLADGSPSWRPILRWSRAEYRRLRGEHELALEELQAALSQAPVGRHRLWHFMAASRIEVLVELQRVGEACEVADASLRVAEEAGLSPFHLMWVRAAAGLAHGASGSERGAELVDAALAQLRAEGGGGLPLARLLEIRARVAHLLDDRATVDRTLAELRGLADLLQSRPLTVRLRTLTRAIVGDDAVCTEDESPATRRIANAPEEEVPRVALQVLLEDASRTRGLLYVVRGDGFACAASQDVDPTTELQAAVNDFMQAEISRATEVTVTMADLAEARNGHGRAHFLSPEGEAFEFLPLRFVRDGALWICGVFVSVRSEQKQLVTSVDLAVASELSRHTTLQSLLAAG